MNKIFKFGGIFALLALVAFPTYAALPSPSDMLEDSMQKIDPDYEAISDAFKDPELIDVKPTPYKPLPEIDVVIPPALLLGPKISDIRMAVNENSLLIEWKTNISATSKIEYGSTSNYTKSLEDTEMATNHAMAIPAEPGTLHLRISSADSAGRVSKSQDITVAIPEMEETDTANASDTPTSSEAVTSDGDSDQSGQAAVDEPAENSLGNEEEIEPLLEIQGVDAPEDNQSSLSFTNVFLGGLALLLAGVLIGVLFRNAKKEEKQ